MVRTLTTLLGLLIFFAASLFAQPDSHQSWQSATISSGAITITCYPLNLPHELGRLLVESTPTTTCGEMCESLSSSHPVKVEMQPESGVTDDLTAINGCTTDGARIILATADAGDTITVKHTPAVIELSGDSDIVLDDPEKLFAMHRKDGVWVPESGFGNDNHNHTTANLTDFIYDSDADCEANADATLKAFCADTTDGSLWLGNGTDALKIGPGTTQTLQQAYDSGKTITGANSLANAVKISDDGTNSMSFYVNAGQPTIETDCNGSPCDWIVSRNAGADTITIDNSSNVTLVAGLKETFSRWVPAQELTADGTNCSDAARISINSVPTMAIICTANDASGMFYTMNMPDRWDAGTFNIRVSLLSDNANPINDFDIDWAMQCRGAGEALGGWSGETATDFDFDANGSCGVAKCDQYDIATVTTSVAITPTGTCAKGDVIWIKGEVDAAGSTATAGDIHILGITVEWTADDWSDE